MPPVLGRPVKANEPKLPAIEIYIFGTLKLKIDKSFFKGNVRITIWNSIKLL